jgi:hypothetical protein
MIKCCSIISRVVNGGSNSLATHFQKRAQAQILYSLGAKDPKIQVLLGYYEVDFNLSDLQTLGSLPFSSACGFLTGMALLRQFCKI